MTYVSIIIPTFNRLSRLKQVLAALEQQKYAIDEVEVIVVSDGSTDGTDAFLSSLQTKLNLIFVPQVNAGPAAARNNGIKHAKGEYILFIDDDVVPSPQLVAEHMRLHAQQPNLIVLGPMLTPADEQLSAWVDWEQAMLEKQYRAMQSGKWEATHRQFYTGNTSLARQLLMAVGGFDERFRRAEDVELAYRLLQEDVSFVFNPQAIGYHYATRSLRSWMEIPYAYGRNDVIFAREIHTEILSLIRKEFRWRNKYTQVLVRLSVDRARISKLIIAIFLHISEIIYNIKLPSISRTIYSVVFNIRYYQGVCDELGGRKVFFGNVKSDRINKPASS